MTSTEGSDAMAHKFHPSTQRDRRHSRMQCAEGLRRPANLPLPKGTQSHGQHPVGSLLRPTVCTGLQMRNE